MESTPTKTPMHPYLHEKTQHWLDWTRRHITEAGLAWVEPEVHHGEKHALSNFPAEVFLVWKNPESATGKMVTVAVKHTEMRYARRDSEQARHDPDGPLGEDTFPLLWYWLWHE